MPAGVVTHLTVEKFQEQYGTLWNAATVYFNGDMPPVQASAFERVVDPAFLAAVAQTRLLTELVDTVRRNELR